MINPVEKRTKGKPKGIEIFLLREKDGVEKWNI
jgi:hypothetical protein